MYREMAPGGRLVTMTPGGRYVTRMSGNTQAQYNAGMVNSQVVLGATTHVDGSSNTTGLLLCSFLIKLVQMLACLHLNLYRVHPHILGVHPTLMICHPNLDVYQGLLVIAKLGLTLTRLIHMLYLMLPRMLRFHPTLKDHPSMEEIQMNNEETNSRLEEAERRADDAEMRRGELSIEMVNKTRKIEELENWKARLELFMSNFGPAFPSGMDA